MYVECVKSVYFSVVVVSQLHAVRARLDVAICVWYIDQVAVYLSDVRRCVSELYLSMCTG